MSFRFSITGARALVEDNPDELTSRMLDDGPGITETELDKVFEPSYPREDLRSGENRGGDIVPRSRAQGGLEAIPSWPSRGVR